MTNEDSETGSSIGLRTAARVGWGVLIVVTLALCYFSNLGAIGFVGPDEPRYAWIARDMAETGDWVTPRLYGKPWFEKPVLYYWMAGASFKLFGVSEAAARLPSAICALFATLALAWLAWRIYCEATARWLLLLLPTSVGMIGFSHAAATDMPFSAMLTIAMVSAAIVLGLARTESTPILSSTPWLALILFGFFLGLAVLAKGPAAIVLSGGGVSVWAIFTKRWRDAFRLLHPVAILSFCLTALPWYILCAHRNPDFFRVFIVEHNFKRYLTPEFQHIQPFWFYLPILLVAFLPWTIPLGLIAATNRLGLSKEGRSDHLQLFFWVGAIFCLAFFSASKSKLPGYILPAIPFLAFAISPEFQALATGSRKYFRWIMTGGAILLIVASLAIDFLKRYASPMKQLTLEGIGVLLVSLALPLLIIGFFFCGKPKESDGIRAQLFVSLMFCVLFVAGGFALRSLDSSLSSRYLAEKILTVQTSRSGELRAYHLQRSRAYQINFYLHTELLEFNANEKNIKYVVCSLEGATELVRSGLRIKSYIYGRGVSNEANLYELVPETSAGGPAGSGQVR